MKRTEDSSGNQRERTPEPSPPNNVNESSTHPHGHVWEIGSTHSDGHMHVDVMDKVLEPSNTCSHKITNIMYERLEPTRFNWKAVSKETKDFYFEEFKAKELKRKPHPGEVFKHTHFKAGKWVEEKRKSYNNGLSETSQFHDADCQMMQAKLHDMEDQMKVMQERQEYHLKVRQEQQQEQLKAIQEEHK
ncbi:hypothetical protein AgCh_020701 [Apium graveolens]